MNKQWLLAISVGPVGEFIAAGRRSRDLWWGSVWLSELVLALRTECNGRGKVLLPNEDREQPPRQSGTVERHGGRVANKMLIQVAGEEEAVQQLAEALQTAAHHWMARTIEEQLGLLIKRTQSTLVRSQDIRDQVEAIRSGDFVEFRAGWADLEGSFEEAHRLARERCEAAPRLFRTPTSRPGLPKCSLDPGRDSVLIAPDPKRDPEGHRASLLERARRGILDGEELDAIFLARRLASFSRGNERTSVKAFPSVVRIAMEPWLDGARGEQALTDVRTELMEVNPATDEDFFAWCSPAFNPSEGVDFPFDSSFMLEGELEARLADAQRRGWSPARLMKLRPRIVELHRRRGAPIPYYALIAMDGDGVGHALSRRSEDDWNSAIGALNTFSDGVEPVTSQHGAVAFYAAGDELLIYAPVDTAVPLAGALIAHWDTCLRAPLPGCSISAGVVFAHVKDDLAEIRQAAHAALRAAKRERRLQQAQESYVRVEERPRGGAPRGVTGPFGAIHRDLARWGEGLNADNGAPLSLRTAHILDEFIVRLPTGGLEETRGALIRQVQKAPKVSGQTRRELLERVLGLREPSDRSRLRDELLLAARIARVAQQREKAR